MKFSLGTAQVGLDYGIANVSGKVTLESLKEILAEATSSNIDTLDTAASYGSSEQALGQVGVQGWNVITKLPLYDDSTEDSGSWVATSIKNSLRSLRLDSLGGVLIHDVRLLLGDHGLSVMAELIKFREQGLVKKIGVSVYSPDELEGLSDLYHFDIVQCPMNIFDRRFLDSGWIDRLNREGVEIHVRSAFLQGLLLMSNSSRPVYFSKWRGLFSAYEEWLAFNDIAPLEACLGFLLRNEAIEKVIIGIDTVHQLRQIVTHSVSVVSPPKELSCIDEDLVNPSRWPK